MQSRAQGLKKGQGKVQYLRTGHWAGHISYGYSREEHNKVYDQG